MIDTANENLPEQEQAAEAVAEEATATQDDAARLAAEVADLKDKLLRALAETENLRRRAEREKQEAGAYAATAFARDLLTVADTFRRALDSLSPAAREDAHFKAFVEGIELTERELMQAFEKHGIRKIDPKGEKFDHNLHQAMLEIPTDEQAPGTVVQVLQPGYVIKDRLLRAAMVAVAKSATPNGAAPRVDTKV